MNAIDLYSQARIAVLIGLALATGAQAGDAAGVARVRGQAPAFMLPQGAQGQLTLQSFAHKPLVINVFASWCPPCREELPRIVAAAHAERGRIAFLGVDEQEPVEIGTRFIRAMKIRYPVGFDSGQFAASYGANALPVTIFIGADGTVSAIHHGTITAAQLQREIAAISR